MTRSDSHATTGASALQLPTAAGPARSDAWRSISLFGTAAATMPAPAEGSSPIDAARAWLADPARTPQIPPSLLAYVHDSLTLAEQHYRELDLLAGELATEVSRDDAVIDHARMAVVDRMADDLHQFSSTLRHVLDTVASDPETAEQRLSNGLAAGASGGLRSFLTAF